MEVEVWFGGGEGQGWWGVPGPGLAASGFYGSGASGCGSWWEGAGAWAVVDGEGDWGVEGERGAGGGGGDVRVDDAEDHVGYGVVYFGVDMVWGRCRDEGLFVSHDEDY